MKTTVLALALATVLLVPTAVSACTGFLCDYHPYRYDNYGNRYLHYDDTFHYRERYYEQDFYGRYGWYAEEEYYRPSRFYYDDFDHYYDKPLKKKTSTYYRWYW